MKRYGYTFYSPDKRTSQFLNTRGFLIAGGFFLFVASLATDDISGWAILLAGFFYYLFAVLSEMSPKLFGLLFVAVFAISVFQIGHELEFDLRHGFHIDGYCYFERRPVFDPASDSYYFERNGEQVCPQYSMNLFVVYAVVAMGFYCYDFFKAKH